MISKNTLTRLFVLLLFPFMTIPVDAQENSGTISEIDAFELYDQINSTDIALGKLALTSGKNAAVRGLGRMITDDHYKIRQEARDIAKRYNLWSKPDAYEKVIPAFAESIRKLETVSEASFDASYLAVEIKYSNHALDQVERVVLPATSNPELKTLIARSLARMKSHMEHILMAEESVKSGNQFPHHMHH